MEKLTSNKITLSVITICYNNKNGFERTKESVCSQTFKDKEWIVVDGGSTDGTRELLQQFSPCIDFCISEPDNGLYDAINKGIRNASGEWIVCMNAGDCFADENVLSRIFREQIDENVIAIYSDFWQATSTGEASLCIMDRGKGKLMHQSFIYRKEAHREYGYYQVTHPIVNSDLFFMLSIPQEKCMKTDTPISINDFGGVSQEGTWCEEAALGLLTAYRMISLPQAFTMFCKVKIKAFLPERFKIFIKKRILKRYYKRINHNLFSYG